MFLNKLGIFSINHFLIFPKKTSKHDGFKVRSILSYKELFFCMISIAIIRKIQAKCV